MHQQPAVCTQCAHLSAALHQIEMSGQVEISLSGQMLQVPASAYYLLRRHFSQEEAIFPQLCQHCNLWSPRHIHCLCSHRLRPVRLLQASQCAQLLSKLYYIVVRWMLSLVNHICDFANPDKVSQGYTSVGSFLYVAWCSFCKRRLDRRCKTVVHLVSVP